MKSHTTRVSLENFKPGMTIDEAAAATNLQPILVDETHDTKWTAICAGGDDGRWFFYMTSEYVRTLTLRESIDYFTQVMTSVESGASISYVNGLALWLAQLRNAIDHQKEPRIPVQRKRS